MGTAGAVQPAIAVRRLTKAYGAVRAVDGLSFEVAAGTICVLLGRNGAGKTTTVECLEGYRVPDAGQVRVLGLDPRADRDAFVARVGVLLQSGGAYQAATCGELLRLHASFHPDPVPPAALLDRVGLAGHARSRYRTLSGGERQRLRLALALVGRPAVVILDEPTSGLDVVARRETWALLQELRDAGVTVLLTTHLLDEAERLADTVAVIDAGRLAAFDSPAALAAAAPSGRLLVTTPAAVDAAALAAAVGAPVEQEAPGRYLVTAGGDAIPTIAAWFARRSLPLSGVSQHDDGLEAAFLRLTAGDDRP